ncbi:MAG: extracellular solute-binding protein [Alphaproteobacteria bacterium]
MRRLFAAGCLSLALSFPLLAPSLAQADDWKDDPTYYGLAMHGSPKYAADFQHLDYANPDAPKGGTLRLAATGTFDSLQSSIVRGRKAAGLRHTAVKLFQRVWDEPFAMYPYAATSVQMNEDRTRLTFHLRENATWHDGTPITPEDVLFSIEAYKTMGRPNARRVYGMIKTAEKVGPRSVHIDLGETKDRELALILSMMTIRPKQYWEQVKADEDRDFDETTLTPPLSGGPYTISNVKPGESITYTRVKDWWGADLPVMRGHHNFETIRYDYYRDDQIALEAFLAQEVDFRREGDAGRWATGYDLSGEKAELMQRDVTPRGRPERSEGFIFNFRREPFDDRRVREALILAFDGEWINANILQGVMSRTASIVPNSELAPKGEPGPLELEFLEPWRGQIPDQVFGPAYHPPKTDGSGARGQRANLRAAKKLLEQAGFETRDGVLVNASTGEPFTFELLLNGPGRERMALEWGRALKRLGIELKVRVVESAQFVQRLNTYDYDTLNFSWGTSLSPGNEQVFYWGSQMADTEGSRNYPGFKSVAIDTLAASIAAQTDRDRLVANVHALDRIIMQSLPMVPLFYYGNDRVAYWPPITRPAKTPVSGVVIETWWVADGDSGE